MKSVIVGCVGLVVMALAPVRAQDVTPASPRFTRATIEQSVETLLNGIRECKDPCMRISSAQTMGQLKELYPERSFSEFVIPLMRIVKDESLEPCPRIVAAIALHTLQSTRGDFAIERTAHFTDDPRVKHICEWLTYYKLREGIDLLPSIDLVLADYGFEPLEEFTE